MTTITIRTIGNRALYRDLYESIDSESTHRTATGAARRLISIAAKADRWYVGGGQWGRLEIAVDGKALDQPDVITVMEKVDLYRRYHGTRSLGSIAKLLAA